MSAEVHEVEAQIAETRAALAETTEALAAKADVKNRVKGKVVEDKVPLAVVAAVCASCAVVVALLAWRRRK